MALSVREMMLIVSAQNRASGALRRVARDVGGLRNVQGLQRRAQQLRINEQVLRQQRQQAMYNEQSYRSGLKSLQMEKARASQRLATMRADIAASNVTQRMTALEEQRLRNQARIIQLQSARPRLPHTQQMRDLRLAAANIEAERLAKQEAILRREMEAATAAVKRQSMAIRELAAKEAEAARMADYWAGRQNVASLRLSKNAGAIRELNQAISDARWEKLNRVGSAIQHTGRIAQYFGLVVGGALAYSAKQAADFSTSVGLAATQTRSLGGTAEETARHSVAIQKQIISLMRQFPATADDMSKAAYDLYSSTNVSFRGGLKALKLFNQAAVAGGTDVATATTAGITVLNNFGNSVSTLGPKLQRMFAAVRFGRMTFQNFADSISTIAPAARSAGQSFDDMAGAFAFLTRHLNLGQARTGYARLLEILSGPQMQKGLKAAGVNIDTVGGKLKPLDQVIGILIKKFPYLTKGGVATTSFFKNIGNIQGTIQARRAFTFLTQFFDKAGKDGASYLGMLRQVKGDNNEFTRSLQAMEKTTGVRWGVFVNNLKAIALQIGTAVIPMLSKLGGILQHAFDWWNHLDSATQKHYAHLLAWTAGISLGGSALLVMLGVMVRMFALMGKGVGLFNTLLVVVGLVGTAVAVLSGNWRSLNGIIDTFVSYGTGSLVGWITMLGLAAGAAIKLSGALRGVGAASAGAGLAGGIGGLLRGGRNVGAVGGMVAADVRAAQGLGKLRTLGMGLAASVALIPGPLWIAGAAIAAAAGGALLWKHHMDAVAKSAQEIKNETDAANRAAQAAAQPARAFGGLGGDVESLLRAKIALQDINKELRSAKGTDRQRLLLDRADAVNALNMAQDKTNRTFDKFSIAVRKNNTDLAALGNTGNRLTALERERANIVDRINRVQSITARGGGKDPTADLKVHLRDLDHRINITRQNFNTLLTGTHTSTATLQRNFATTLKNLGRMQQIPMPSARAIQDAFRLAMTKGRMLTIPEIRALIHAEVDPRSLARVRGDIRKAIQQGERDRMVAAGKASIVNIKPKIAGRPDFLKYPFGKSPVALLTTVRRPPNAARVRKGVADIFRKNIVQDVRFRQPTSAQRNAVATGLAIAQGISRGINAGSPAVTAAAIAAVDNAMSAARTHAGIRSPSTLFAKQVGKPIGQGIAMGLLQARGDIQKAAVLVLDILNGTFLQNRENALKPVAATKIKQLQIAYESAEARLSKKHGDTAINRQKAALAQEKYNNATHRGHLTAQDLTKDLANQLTQFRKFNQAIATLRGRKVPAQLLVDLEALGAEGADKIALLARMSAPQLKKYVDLWKKSQKEISKSAHYTQADVKTALKGLADDAAQNLLQTYNAFHDTNTQNFGDLFAGPTDLASHIGDAFQSAMDQYNQSVDDFQKQIRDLNQQIADTQAQALASAIDSFQQQFGQLFGGEVLQNNVAAGFDQLFGDLQSQVDRFNKWRNTLTSLASKVPPELAKQLAALGPDATANLEILNNATGDQLSSYVALWQQGQAAIGQAAQAQVATDADLAKQISDMVAQIGTITDQLAALSAPQPLNGQMIIDDVNKQLAAWNEYQGTLDSLAKRGLPAELIQQLSQMGPQAEPYLKALASLTDTQLLGPGGFVDSWSKAHKAIDDATTKMMQRQLQQWYTHGANIAAAIIAGVASEQDILLGYFRNLFSSLLTGTTPSFTPPPTGTYTGPGTGGGLQPGPQAGQTGAGVSSGQNQGFGGAGGIYVAPGASLIEVNAVQDESLDSALQRAAFRLGNRT